MVVRYFSIACISGQFSWQSPRGEPAFAQQPLNFMQCPTNEKFIGIPSLNEAIELDLGCVANAMDTIQG